MRLNQPSGPKGFSANIIRIMGYLFLLLGIAGQSILQNRLLGLNSLTSAEFLELWDTDPSIMGIATTALVFQALQTCAVPLFSFLLAEGFSHTSDPKNYLIRVAVLALVTEIPYNLAISGAWIDFSSRNPVFGLALCIVMMMLWSRYQEKGAKNTAIKVLIAVAAFVWAKMLGIDEGVCLVILVGTFRSFRNKPGLRNLAGMAAACICSMFSMFYLAAPMAVLALHFYNGEPGPNNRIFNYAIYPLALLCFGLVAMFI